MTDRIAALDQYVELHVQESMQELARLCNQPSISSQGLGMRECAALVAELLRSRGMAAQVIETGGYPVVFGEYGTGERTLLLYNHYDVQPPVPLDKWESPPLQRCSAMASSLLVAPKTTKENSSRGWLPSMRFERSMETCRTGSSSSSRGKKRSAVPRWVTSSVRTRIGLRQTPAYGKAH
jgi:hypothetical protein